MDLFIGAAGEEGALTQHPVFSSSPLVPKSSLSFREWGRWWWWWGEICFLILFEVLFIPVQLCLAVFFLPQLFDWRYSDVMSSSVLSRTQVKLYNPTLEKENWYNRCLWTWYLLPATSPTLKNWMKALQRNTMQPWFIVRKKHCIQWV